MAQKSTRRSSRGMQQFGQRPQSLSPQVAQLLAVGFLHRFVESAKKFKPVRSDPRHHHSAIFGFPAARDKIPLFQPVKKARDVRIAGDHAASNLAAGEAIGRAPEDPQHVVLVAREIVRLKNRSDAAPKQVRRAQQV